MTPIQIIATPFDDYPFSLGQYQSDVDSAYRSLHGYSRLQIQRALVRELEQMDAAAWNEFQSAYNAFQANESTFEMVKQAQEKAYRIRERLTQCSRRLSHLQNN